MSSLQVEWSCSQCQSTFTNRRKFCTDCNSMLTWTCIGSERSGLYKNFFRHRDNCIHCTSEIEDRSQEVEEKHCAIQKLKILNNGN
jgi:hypothetical protein